MSERALFSVLIYTEHEPESLEDLLRSLECQHYPRDRMEVCVLDPANDPKRRCAAERYGAYYIETSSANEPGSLNQGLKHVKGDLIAVTDDDCQSLPGWLGLYEEALTNGTSLAGGPDRVPVDARRFLKYLDCALTSLFGSGVSRSRGLGGRSYYPRRWNMAFNRETAIKVGGFNEMLSESWEMDFAGRVRAADEAVKFLPKALIQHKRDTNIGFYMKRSFRLALDRGREGRIDLFALPAFCLLSAMILLVASASTPVAGAILVCCSGLYGLLHLGAGLHAAISMRDSLALVAVPGMIFLQHLMHGSGYLTGLMWSGGSYVRNLFRHIGSYSCL